MDFEKEGRIKESNGQSPSGVQRQIVVEGYEAKPLKRGSEYGVS